MYIIYIYLPLVLELVLVVKLCHSSNTPIRTHVRGGGCKALGGDGSTDLRPLHPPVELHQGCPFFRPHQHPQLQLQFFLSIYIKLSIEM